MFSGHSHPLILRATDAGLNRWRPAAFRLLKSTIKPSAPTILRNTIPRDQLSSPLIVGLDDGLNNTPLVRLESQRISSMCQNSRPPRCKPKAIKPFQRQGPGHQPLPDPAAM